MAAAGPDHHVAVLFENDVGAVVKVEHGDGVELRGRTARLGHRVWVDKMDQRLHNGVVCGVHVGVQREGALSLTVVRSVALRSNDPVLPSQVSETDVELVLLTRLLLISAAVFCDVGHPQSLLVFCWFGAVGVSLFVAP